MTKKLKKKKSHIPLRLNILFSIIVVLFGLLVWKLVDLQLFKESYYAAMINATQAVKTSTDMTRGQILDRNGKVLVGNVSYKTIDYTRYDNGTDAILSLAQTLTGMIDLDVSDVSERQLQDYWIATHTDEMNARLSSAEKQLSGSKLVEAQLAKMTAEDIANYTDTDKKTALLYSKMVGTSFLGTSHLKTRNVTDTEVANITERLTNLNGVTIGSTWERTYPQGDTLKSLFGSVSSEQAGLPEGEQNYYLALGYSNNARVGTSYLEEQYDAALRGTPKTVSTTLDAKGNIVSSETTYEGKQGDNLYLSLDIDFQKKVDSILEQTLLTRSWGNDPWNDSLYAVVQDVKTGAVLAISGKKFAYDEATDSLDRSKVEDDVLGVLNSSFSMGSAVKAATVTAGYRYGVISTSNNVLVDEPLSFDNGATTISSVFNRSGQMSIDDEEALERSSNVYMVKLAMMIGGQTYQAGNHLNIKDDTIDKLRSTFNEYGLGVRTGIDVSEGKGYSATETTPFDALMDAFGQFDLYTPLQLSQYMTTIANGGYRYAPRLVAAIRNANLLTVTGRLSTDMAPTILNQVTITDEQMDRIHQGLYKVTHGIYGTNTYLFSGYSPSVSGKTGTAEAFYNGPVKSLKGQATDNHTFAGYAPSNDPEISVTVVAPNFNTTQTQYDAARAVQSIISAYYNK